MHTVYLVPGLGTDERIFRNLEFNYPTKIIKWAVPHPKETLPHYAMRLAEQIDTQYPFSMVGVSFGGMCALEIAKVLNPVKTILISSAKTEDELPFKIKLLRLVPLHKYINDRMYIRLAFINARLLGIRTVEQNDLFKKMLESLPPYYFMRSVNCIAHWKNKEYPSNIYHLHGDKDTLIPYRNIKNPIRIKGGTHLMVLNRAREINRILSEILL